MLLQFAVENYLSFKDEVLLNMIPAKSQTMKDHLLVNDKGPKATALPLAMIYGANASGKSNLITALEFCQKLILKGTSVETPTGVVPFQLNPESKASPSRFEFIFKHDDTIYTYGMVLSSKEVKEEWLFSRGVSKKEVKLFERITENGKVKVEPGNQLASKEKDKGFIEFVARGTRPNQLFLSEGVDKNIEQLMPIRHWFKDHLVVISPDTLYGFLELRVHHDSRFTEYLEGFLALSDVGISGLSCHSERFIPEKHLPFSSPDDQNKIQNKIQNEDFRQMLIPSPKGLITISKNQDDQKVYCITMKTKHQSSDGSVVEFDLNSESDGTKRLMHLAPLLLEVWDKEKVCVIDEIDRSLHTMLSKMLLELFLSGVTKKISKGQFVCTTHDTNLLDRDMLRRDEIWFVEKDKDGASHLSSLAEFKVTDGLNYENGYLNGRFGAIPFVGDVSKLLSEGS